MDDGVVLRADVFRPLDDKPHPVHSLLRRVRQGPGVSGGQQERLGPHDRGLPEVAEGLDLQVPGLGTGRSGEMGARRLRLSSHRLARRRPLPWFSRSVVAARDEGHLRLHRMGRGAAVVQRQGRDERHFLFRLEPVVRRAAQAAASRRHLRVGRLRRLVSRVRAPRRHLLRLSRQSLSARLPSRAARTRRARVAQPCDRRTGVRSGDLERR